jgi:hypothetical protein
MLIRIQIRNESGLNVSADPDLGKPKSPEYTKKKKDDGFFQFSLGIEGSPEAYLRTILQQVYKKYMTSFEKRK